MYNNSHSVKKKEKIRKKKSDRKRKSVRECNGRKEWRVARARANEGSRIIQDRTTTTTTTKLKLNLAN